MRFRPRVRQAAGACLACVLIPAPAAAEPVRRESRRSDGSVLHWAVEAPRSGEPRGVLVVAQGSGCLPTTMNPRLREFHAVAPDHAVVTVEKYGVAPQDAPKDPTEDCRPEYWAKHTITQRANDYAQVLEELRAEPGWKGPLVLFGGSEGGAAVVRAAHQVRPTAVIVYSTGLGGRFEDTIKAVLPPAVAAQVEAEMAAARANPNSAKRWGGASYKWWADVIDADLVDELRRSSAPVLTIHGGRDRSAPVSTARAVQDAYAGAGRCELTYWEYPDYDHFMEDAAGRSHRPEVIARVRRWLASSPPGAGDCPSGPVAEAVRTWRTTFEAERKRLAALPPPVTVAENLRRRVQLEQVGRSALGALLANPALPPSDRRAAMTAAWSVLGPVDDDNLAYVRSALPADGWFRKSRDGDQAGRDAWLIVQHASDRAFQRRVLAAMKPLVGAGEARGTDYALLYDRLEMYEGRPQLYGSQAICTNGKRSFHPIAQPERVDERRRAMGFKDTHAEYGRRLGVGGRC